MAAVLTSITVVVCVCVRACVRKISQNDSHLKRKTLLDIQNTRINALLMHATQQGDRSKPVSDRLNGCGYQEAHTRRIILKRICLWGDYCEVAGWFPIMSLNPEKGGKAPAAGEGQGEVNLAKLPVVLFFFVTCCLMERNPICGNTSGVERIFLHI